MSGGGIDRAAGKTLLVAVLLAAAVICAYLPVVRQGGFVWDDDYYLTQNKTMGDPGGLRAIWLDPRASPQYYPLVFTSFWLERRLWGADPRGYHAVNVVLHAASTVVLWLLLSRLAVPGALLAAAIFGLHPVHVESVAWIAERKNVLSGLLYLLSLRVLLGWYGLGAGEGGDPAHAGRGRLRDRAYLSALALFACALLSKTVTASLPAAALLVLWWKRGRLALRDVLPLLPFFAAGAASGLATAALESTHVGASGPDWSFSFPSRVLIAGRALWFYAGKLLWPADLTFSYPRWAIDEGSWPQYLFPLAALLVVALLWGRRRRIGRGPLVAVLFFAGTLFPALGFVNVYPMLYSFVADHFQYLASIGVIALVSAALALGAGMVVARADAAGARRWLRAALAGAAAALLALLGSLTWRQTLIYRDSPTLWLDTIAKNPGSWMAHNNLGNLLMERGDLAGALEHLQTAVRLRPGHLKARYNIGNALLRLGRPGEAIGKYREAIALGFENALVYNNLGLALASQGRVEEAVAQYRRALAFEPGNVVALRNLGSDLAALGRWDEAIAALLKALSVAPDDLETHLALARGYAATSDRGAAVRHYLHALRIDPGSATARRELEMLR